MLVHLHRIYDKWRIGGGDDSDAHAIQITPQDVCIVVRSRRCRRPQCSVLILLRAECQRSYEIANIVGTDLSLEIDVRFHPISHRMHCNDYLCTADAMLVVLFAYI